jgi:ParB/RepB/Spo0J family partition protein
MSERKISPKERLKRAHAEFLLRKRHGVENVGSNGNGNGNGVTSLPGTMEIHSVPLSEIDHEDQRFQWRVNVSHADLKESIEKDGLQVPLVLWGKSKPYKVIDGFRRLHCARDLNWTEIEAVIRGDITEEEAYKLSFIENVKRKNLSAVDKAHAIWHAMYKRGLDKEPIAEAFSISVRQVERYLAIVDYPEALQKSLLSQEIAMGHAVLLSRSRGVDIPKEIERIRADVLSVPQLRKSLRARLKGREPRKYWQKLPDGFRVHSFRVGSKTSATVRERIRESLREVLAYLEEEQ